MSRQLRRTQKERVEDSTRRLMDATEQLIAEVGYDAATAAEIGRRAGFSRSMVRARFGSKEQLVDAVIRSAYDSRLDASLSESMTGLENLLARIEALGSAVEENPAMMRLIYMREFGAVGAGRPTSGWIARLQADALEAIRLGQRDGSINPALAAEDVAHDVAVIGFGSAFLWSTDPADEFRRHLSRWRTRIFEALKPLR